jgi:hypothetical protein
VAELTFQCSKRTPPHTGSAAGDLQQLSYISEIFVPVYDPLRTFFDPLVTRKPSGRKLRIGIGTLCEVIYKRHIIRKLLPPLAVRRTSSISLLFPNEALLLEFDALVAVNHGILTSLTHGRLSGFAEDRLELVNT